MKKELTPSMVRYPGSFSEKANVLKALGCERIHVDVVLGLDIPGLLRYENFGSSERGLFMSAIDLHVFDLSEDKCQWEDLQIPLRQGDCFLLHIFPATTQSAIESAVEFAHENKFEIGVAVDTKLSVEIAIPFLGELNLVTVMGIEVGGKKLPLNEEAIAKIIQVRLQAERENTTLRTSIDGGVNVETFEALARVADSIVVGSLLFDAPDLLSQWRTLNTWLMEVSKQ